MSLATLADDEILRTSRGTIDLAHIIDPRLQQLTLPDDATRTAVRAALRSVAVTPPIQGTTSSNVLDGLVKYIPTETVTLYVAATAAITELTATFPWLTPYVLYWIFVVLTPTIFLLIYMGKRRSQNLSFLPPHTTSWPWWKLIASIIAFGIWALAVPPLVTTDAGKVVAAFGAIGVSAVLSLVGAVVEPREA
jgi:RsiW-degrading membrane proteinase PrsW (M82 family)